MLPALVVVGAAWPHQVLAQYALGEVGIRAAGGAFLPLGAAQTGDWSAGPVAEAGAFYTHYLCGTRGGYHLEAGLSYLGYRGIGAAAEPGSKQFTDVRAYAGVYFKFRPVNFHRKQEFALLVGPRLDVTVAEPQAHPAGKRLHPAAHLSAWYRLPAGRDRSLMLQAGVLYYPFELTEAEGSPTGLTAFAGVGYTLWRN